MGQKLTRYRTKLADSTRWEGFEFRDGDIVISTPPKCGTTWMQMICALLIFQTADLPRPLTELSPWVDIQTDTVENVFARLAAQNHRRFIKSHTPLDGLPHDPRVTYVTVGRDPRDVAVSDVHHGENMDLDRLREVLVEVAAADVAAELGTVDAGPVDLRDQFWEWVEADNPVTESGGCLKKTLYHLSTFWDRRDESNIALFHYADLQADLSGEMRRLAGLLGIETVEARWEELVAAATFEAMSSRAEELAPEVRIPGFWKDTRRFFNNGTTGQWLDLMDPGEQARYDSWVTKWARPDLASWAHVGVARL
jgi:hypothetical protein